MKIVRKLAETKVKLEARLKAVYKDAEIFFVQHHQPKQKHVIIVKKYFNTGEKREKVSVYTKFHYKQISP